MTDMGIGYIFPERRLRDTDVLEPEFVNRPMFEAADKYSGNLNEHAFKENLFSTEGTSLVSTGCFATPTYTAVNATTGLTDNTAAASAAFDFSTANSGTLVPNNHQWSVIDGMSWSRTTQTGQLIIMANFNYAWALHATLGSSDDSASVQFALRIDGTIITDTITGQTNLQYKSFHPNKPTAERTDTAAVPGPSRARTDVIAAMGVPFFSVRFFYTTPYLIPAGAHTVDVVVRRSYGRSIAHAYSSADKVYVFARNLLVLDTPFKPATATTFVDVEITPVETETTLDSNVLDTPLTDLKDAYNDVQPGAVARGAFNNHHLPRRTLLAPAQVTITPGAFRSTANHFPGSTSTTITASTSGTGWYLLNDGAGNDLKYNTTLAISGKKCMVVFLANVEIRDITPGSGADFNNFGLIRFLYTINGVVTVAHRPHVFQHWHYGGAPFQNKCAEVTVEQDIPLMACVDFTGSAAPANITHVGVYIGGTSTSGTTPPTIDYQRCSLQVLVFRP